VYADALVDETTFLLAEYYAALSTSIAFPELALPAIVALRRASKKAAASGGQSRLAALLKQLVEKLESNSTWVEQRREKVEFAPNKRDKVERFLAGEEVGRTPLGSHVKLLSKQRDARKATMDRATQHAEDI
jgi:nucleolar complex protein 2